PRIHRRPRAVASRVGRGPLGFAHRRGKPPGHVSPAFHRAGPGGWVVLACTARAARVAGAAFGARGDRGAGRGRMDRRARYVVQLSPASPAGRGGGAGCGDEAGAPRRRVKGAGTGEGLLAKDVKNLGKKNDVIDEAEGYARNYLIPRGLAAEASAGMLRQRE